jgi:hypothetical protein
MLRKLRFTRSATSGRYIIEAFGAGQARFGWGIRWVG